MLRVRRDPFPSAATVNRSRWLPCSRLTPQNATRRPCGDQLGCVASPPSKSTRALPDSTSSASNRPVPVRLSVSTEKKSPDPDAVAPGDAGLERKALDEPTVLEILRTFEGSTLVKVQPAPPVEVPRNGTAADEDAAEPETPEEAE